MTLQKVLIISLSLVCVHEAVSQDTNPAQGRRPAISVSLRAEHDTVKAGTPVILKKTLTNRSDHTVTFGRDVYHPSCAAAVSEVLPTEADGAASRRGTEWDRERVGEGSYFQGLNFFRGGRRLTTD